MDRTLRFIAAGTLLVAVALPGAAHAATDRNHDRIPDRWERSHHLSLKVDQAKRDQDRDGLRNLAEYRDHTDPRRRDSDHDGLPDGGEDADHDGVTNAEEQTPPGAPPAGADEHPEPVAVVASFGEGVLDLRRDNGEHVVAHVDGRTRLLCAPPVEPATAVPCPVGRLLAGTHVLVARHTGDHWDLLIIRAAAGDPPPPAPPVEPVPPAPAPVSPAPTAAPASTGTITAVADGSITVTRPQGEVVPGRVRDSTVLRCIRVSGGLVVSNEPCSRTHLVVGAQVALAQRSLVEGVWTWTTITLLEAVT